MPTMPASGVEVMSRHAPTPLSPDPGTSLWTIRTHGVEWTAVVRLYPRAQQLLILYNGAEFSSQMFPDSAALLEAAEARRQEIEADVTLTNDSDRQHSLRPRRQS